MKDIDSDRRSEFDDEWSKAFEGAKIEPSDELWTKLEYTLDRKQNTKFKKTVIFYKWVAAASIVTAIGLFAINYQYYYKNSVNATSVLETSSKDSTELYSNKEQKESNSYTLEATELNQFSGNEYNTLKANMEEKGKDDSNVVSKNLKNETNLTHPIFSQKNNHRYSLTSNNFVDLNNSSQEENSNLKNEEVQQVESKDFFVFTPIIKKNIMFQTFNITDYKTTTTEIVENDDERTKKPAFLWAGVNFSSGYFNPNFKSEGFSNYNSNKYADATNSPANQLVASSSGEDTEEGNSYSFGFNFAMKINKKWFLQSGIQYAYLNSSKATGTYLEDSKNNTNYPSHYASLDKPESAYARFNVAPQNYTMKNDFQFTSIPLKAGYFVVQKKLSWLVSFGFSTDIFIKNTLSSENNQLQQVTNVPGDKSPYRPLYFNGLVGSALSYNFLGNYSFSLEPSYRMGLGSLTKETASFSSKPYVFEIQTGIKYMF